MKRSGVESVGSVMSGLLRMERLRSSCQGSGALDHRRTRGTPVGRRARAIRAGVAVSASLLFGLVLVVPAGSAPAAAQQFDSREVARLRAGRLVTRPVVRRRGNLHLVGGTSFQVVNLPLEAVWETLSDPSLYERMLPSARSADVVSERGDRAVLRIVHQLGPVSASYHLALSFHSRGHDIDFELDSQRRNDLRAAWGFLQAAPYEDGRTLLTWGVLADPGGGLLAGLVRGQIHDWMLQVPADIRRFLHRRARTVARR